MLLEPISAVVAPSRAIASPSHAVSLAARVVQFDGGLLVKDPSLPAVAEQAEGLHRFFEGDDPSTLSRVRVRAMSGGFDVYRVFLCLGINLVSNHVGGLDDLAGRDV